MKRIAVSAISIFSFFFLVSPAFAHVVVKPSEVGVATFTTFTVSVPNEKDSPTTSIRLVLPDGLQHVTPTVKAGWQIQTKSSGEGEDTKTTEISWTAGSIPAERRDDFTFSAQVPSQETNLVWKAYQTYEDGTMVSWNQGSTSEEEGETSGPYSETRVMDDLRASEKSTYNFPLLASGFATLLSLIALSVSLKTRKQTSK